MKWVLDYIHVNIGVLLRSIVMELGSSVFLIYACYGAKGIKIYMN